jgi:hypothetical protein
VFLNPGELEVISSFLLTHGLVIAGAMTGYLLFMMVTLNPRVWGYADYPESITKHVPPQTKREKTIAGLFGIPFFVLVLGSPIWSTLLLEAQLGGALSFGGAFVNLFGIHLLMQAGDLFICDLLIVGTLTPSFVIIPGTEHLRDTEYKAFRKFHAKGHAKGIIATIIICVVLAWVIVVF